MLAVWSKKLESLGRWYDQLLTESLGKQGSGPTPMTVVQTRDLHSRGQQHQDGTRDKLINNLFVRTPQHAPIQIGMADRNEDDLNQFAGRTYPGHLEGRPPGDEPGLRRGGPADGGHRAADLSEHTYGPADADADAGDGGGGQAARREPVRPARGGGVQAEHDGDLEGQGRGTGYPLRVNDE